MTSDQAQVVGFVHLLFCAKNIERIGDHATNIAESAYLLASDHSLEPKRDVREMSRTLTGTGEDAEA